jgi:flagellar biosynthesis protein FlhB
MLRVKINAPRSFSDLAMISRRGMLGSRRSMAACTWAIARLRFERRIRMTPQEYADEARSMQANPQVRLLQQRRARK